MTNEQNNQPVQNVPVAPKNIVTCIILSVVTCGIYGIYWMVCLNNDIAALTGRQRITGGMLILLSIVTCGIYTWIWMYNQGTDIDALKTQRGVQSSGTAVLYLVLSLFGLGIVSYALMQNEINNLVTTA